MNENKGSILVVDDNPTNLSVLVDYLEHMNFEVLAAEDGESALELIGYVTPDIILLDVMMPGIDGFETCQRLKSNPKTKEIPVIFMTALANTEDKLKGFQVGAVDYITKPIQHEEMLARLTTHLTIGNLQKVTTAQKIELEANNHRLKALNSQFEADLIFAQKVQQNLLPNSRPNWPDLDIIFYTYSAKRIGGDFYNYHLAEDDKYSIAVNDVSGHGLSAALIMAVSLSLLNVALPLSLRPRDLINHLSEKMKPYTKATGHNWALTYTQLEPGHESDWRLHITNAGGIPPYIRRSDGSVEWVEVFGPPLGTDLYAPDEYDELITTLNQGDLLIIITDGVTEAKNRSGNMFGFNQFKEIIEQGPNTSAMAMLNHLKRAVITFMEGLEPHDDITIVVVHV